MANRIRSIKPEILEDEKTASLSHLQFRLFVGSWIVADDYGNMRGDPDYLRCQIVWATRETRWTVQSALGELERIGLMKSYSVRGQTYYHIVSFRKHQRIDKPGKAKCPGPEDDDGTESITDNHSDNNSKNDSGMAGESVEPSQGSGSGRGNGIREEEWDQGGGDPALPSPPLLTTLQTDTPKPKRRPRNKSARSPIPEGWEPGDSESVLSEESEAKGRGVDLELQLKNLRDWALAKGELRADWDATWRNWLRNARPTQAVGAQGRARSIPTIGPPVLQNLFNDIAALERQEELTKAGA